MTIETTCTMPNTPTGGLCEAGEDLYRVRFRIEGAAPQTIVRCRGHLPVTVIHLMDRDYPEQLESIAPLAGTASSAAPVKLS